MACWAGHAGCEPAHLVGRFARDDIYQRHETGEISDAEFFAGLRASLGIGLSDAQFLEGWNAIFAGEMPGIARCSRAPQNACRSTPSPTPTAPMSNISRKPMPTCSAISAKSFCRLTIGLRKPDAAAYDHVVKAIGVPAGRIVFFDDLAENIEGARARGLTAVHVTSPDDVADALAALGI